MASRKRDWFNQLVELTRPTHSFGVVVQHYVDVHEAMRQVVNRYGGYQLSPGARIDHSVLEPIVTDRSVPLGVRNYLANFYGQNSHQTVMTRANTLAAPFSRDGVRAPNAASPEVIEHFTAVTGQAPKLTSYVKWLNAARRT